jgi:hypothetical protein
MMHSASFSAGAGTNWVGTTLTAFDTMRRQISIALVDHEGLSVGFDQLRIEPDVDVELGQTIQVVARVLERRPTLHRVEYAARILDAPASHDLLVFAIGVTLHARGHDGTRLNRPAKEPSRLAGVS